MASLMSRLCPLCEARALRRVSLFAPSKQPFAQIRLASRLQQRSSPQRPGRMALSPSVASRKAPRTEQGEKTKPRPSRSAGAFGGMNQTWAGARVVAERDRAEFLKERRKSMKSRGQAGDRPGREKKRPGEMKALKMQRALSMVPYGHRTMIKDRIDSITSFDDFPLLDGSRKALGETLSGMSDIRPTPIQRLAIPAILGLADSKGRKLKRADAPQGMQQFLLAAETGSGKTLAYLLPLVEATKRAEMQEQEEEARQKESEKAPEKGSVFELEPPPLSSEENMNAGRPRAIVLLPTAELVDQVGALFKLFSHTVKQRVAAVSANHSASVIRNRLFSPAGVDIVISTPHLLNSIATTTPNLLSRVTHLVIDEADSLLDRSFAPITSGLVDRATPSLKALVLCSATIPRSLDGYLRTRFPAMQRLTTPNLHAIPRRVVLSTVDIDAAPYNGNRDLACADTIWSIGRGAGDDDGAGSTRRVLVFVNERERAAALAAYLQGKGVDAAALSRDTADARAGDLLAAFTAGDRAVRDAAEGTAATTHTHAAGDARILAGTKVLVVTDIASRGIDTLAVRHVVLYDVPHTSIDFIHRLGRTGRMGRRGRGVVLAGKEDRKDVIREVREAMFRGTSLI